MAYLKIVLKSDLCAGNGESFGNAIDTDTVTDAYGLPSIPARRLKGCLRQTAGMLKEMKYPEATEELIEQLFGDAYGKEGALVIDDANIQAADALRRILSEIREGKEYPLELKEKAHPAYVVQMYTQVRGQTRLEEGVAVDNTLRFTRVINRFDPFADPGEAKELSFIAPIYINSKDERLAKLLEACAKATRHIGYNRNHGLGNVLISYHEREEAARTYAFEPIQTEGRVRIEYKVSLDADITLPGHDVNTAIPARSVIGCMAANYLKQGRAEDEAFKKLFLDGRVRWSALTPVINGIISKPAPMYLVSLKNADGSIVNRYTQTDPEWKKRKPKTIEDGYVALKDKNYLFAYPQFHTQYHSSMAGQELYMQDALEAGMIYGGYVETSAEDAWRVLQLLTTAKLRFGRSKSAQYAACSLYGTPTVCPLEEELLETDSNEKVYVVLESDLMLLKHGIYTVSIDAVRELIARKLGLLNELPEGAMDLCSYGTIGGFQARWQLQKLQIPVVKAGSVFCFKAGSKQVQAYIRIGEQQQEGFGCCRVVTQSSLLEEGHVRKVSVDRKHIEPSEEVYSKIVTALLVAAGREAYGNYSRKLAASKRVLPLKRIRKMVSDATDYEDLLDRVDRIKTSDVSSEKEIGNKEAVLSFLKEMYGEDAESRKRIWPSEDGSLAELIWKDEGAREQLLKEWKTPLLQYLHIAHYGKRGIS